MDTKTANQLEKAGDILQYGISAVALLLVLLLDKTLLMPWLCVVVGVFLTTHALKRLFNSTNLGERPNGGEHSFPSGHTSGAFAGAAFMHFGLMLSPFWVIVAYLLAALTGYSRVVSNNHYYRDVIAGAVVAIAGTHALLTML